jgi:uroporphyrinogen III methyltransferase/synthase
MHLKVDVMPAEYVSSKITKAIHAYENVENLRFLLVRAEKANPDLPKELEEMGAIVDDVPFYQTVCETEDRNGAAQRLGEVGAHWLTFTSSSTVEHFHARFDLPSLLKKFPGTKIASIGPETTKALRTLGVACDLEAAPHNIDGLVSGLIKARGKA